MTAEKLMISHTELCLAVAKRYIRKLALYEYKSTIYNEEPDVLVFDFGTTYLFEIKVSMADFKRDHNKEARKKYRVPLWARYLPLKGAISGNKYSEILKTSNGKMEVTFIENEHLGNYRYFVCPWGLIPVDLIPEGWGLLYYKNGKFYRKKESGKFRSNLRKENELVIHALRRYASGDTKGIMLNTYERVQKWQ